MLKSMLFTLIIFLVVIGCQKPTEPPGLTQPNSGLEGQLYANTGPGFHTVMTVATVVVLKSDSTTEVTETKSDSAGTFKIPLAPGEYFLYVKESRDTYVSGPFQVQTASYSEAKAYLYDSRII